MLRVGDTSRVMRVKNYGSLGGVVGERRGGWERESQRVAMLKISEAEVRDLGRRIVLMLVSKLIALGRREC